MNAMEQQAADIMAAVRACVGTVEELSILVLDLPAQMQKKLDEVRAGVAEHITAFGTRVEQAEANMAEAVSKMTLSHEQHGERVKQIEQIIVDNRAGFEAATKSLNEAVEADSQRIADAHEAVTKAAQSTGEALFEINRRLAELPTVEVVDQKVAKVGEVTRDVVQAFSDDVDARFESKGNVLEEVIKSVEAVTGAVAAHGEALDTGLKVMGERLTNELQHTGEQFTESFRSVRGEMKNMHEGHTQALETLQTGAKTVAEFVHSMPETLADFATKEALAGVQTAVVEAVDAFDAGIGKRLAGFEKAVLVVEEAVTELRSTTNERIGELGTELGVVHSGAVDAVKGVALSVEALAGHVDTVAANTDSAHEALKEVRSTTGERLDLLASGQDNMNKSIVGLDETIGKVSERIEESRSFNNERAVETTEIINKLASELRKETETQLEQVVATVQKGLADVTAEVGQVEVRLAETTDASIATVTERVTYAVEQAGKAGDAAHTFGMALSKSTEELLVRHAELTTTVRKYVDETVVKQVETIDAVRAELLESTGTAIGVASEQLDAKVGKLEETVTTVLQGHAEGFETRFQAVNERQADVDATLQAMLKTAATTIANVESVDKDLLNLATSVETFKEASAATHGVFEERLAGGNERFEVLERGLQSNGESLEVVRREVESVASDTTKLREDVGVVYEEHRAAVEVLTTGALEKMIEVEETLAKLPAPIAPQEVDVQAILGQVRKEIAEAVAEVLPDPTLDIDTTYEDGKLRLSFKLADVEKSVLIPVDIGMKYAGTYLENRKYAAGDFVTHKGSGWVCNRVGAGAPGKDPKDWTLFTKRGADARALAVYEYHTEGTRYMKGDFLRHNYKLWQAAANTTNVPEGTVVNSTAEWTLLGGVQ